MMTSCLQNSFDEVARLFTEFFRDLDVVPSDIVAGLVLLRRQQKRRRNWTVKQVSALHASTHCVKHVINRSCYAAAN